MKTSIKLSVLLAGLLSAQMISPASHAGDAILKFPVRNAYPGAVELGFFSQDRPASWKYALAPQSTQTFSLRCESGEYVCVGASPTDNRSTGWGVGFDGKISCEQCCYTCGNAQPSPWVFSATR